MANNLDKHYNDFGGLDTRSNKLEMDPRTLRNGTSNVCYDFEDNITRRGGFQHKDSGGSYIRFGLFEYKFRDPNTGEARTQMLGAGSDYNLYRKLNYSLKITKASGSATGYSIYYDEINNNFVFTVLPALGSVTFTTATTLTSLKASLTALAIAGLTFDVVDNTGASTTSTLPAYHLDCVINSPIEIGSVTNSAWTWEQVPYPDATKVPFSTTRDNYTSQDYEGISAVNANNAIYLTDGGFPLKYDGRTISRMGMPRWTTDLVNPGSYVNVAIGMVGGMTPNASYRYLFQHGYVNENGDEVLGKIVEAQYLSGGTSGFDSATLPIIYPVGASGEQDTGFNVFSCKVNGLQSIIGSGSKTINVQAGHNIKVGMCLRIPVMNWQNSYDCTLGWSFAYYEVTAVSATTVTFNKTLVQHEMPPPANNGAGAIYPLFLTNTSSPTDGAFQTGLVINGCYVPSDLVGTVTEPRSTVEGGNIQAWHPAAIYGAFCRLYRTVANSTTLYRLADVGLSHQYQSLLGAYTICDGLPDTQTSSGVEAGLSRIPADYSLGEELPRACKYLSLWQTQVVQAGRPLSPSTIIGSRYPYHYDTPPTVGAKWGFAVSFSPWLYGENNLCDLQSIYWADPLAPEGFPQSGSFEFAIDTVFADKIKGLSPNKDAFFAFKERSTGILTGSLATQEINLEILESDAGCSSHRSICEVGGKVIWLDGINGFWSCVAGRLPELIGFPICDYQKINSLGLNFANAVATNYALNDWYICSVDGTTFVYDYAITKSKAPRNCWYLFEGFTATSILANAEDELIYSDGTQSWKYKRTFSKYDYTDHTSAITWDLRSAWLHLGAPTVDKSFLYAWINSVQGDFTLQVGQYGNYLEPLMNQVSISFAVESASKKTVKQDYKMSMTKLSSISLRMYNQEKNKYIRIQGYEIQFSPDYDRGEPKK